MNVIPIKEQILQEVDKLNPLQQERLLRLARQMQAETPIGTPGEVMLADLERYQYEPEELDEMLRVIQEETETIDWDSWR